MADDKRDSMEGHNSDVLSSLDEGQRAACLTAFQKIKNLEADRKSINADINAERKQVFAMGIPADAFAFCFKRWKMDPEDRENMDFGIEQLAGAVHQPLQQMDMFDPDADEGDE